MSITQGGPGFPFFAPCVYDYVCGKQLDAIVPTIEDVMDVTLGTTLTEVKYTSANLQPKLIIFHFFAQLSQASEKKTVQQLINTASDAIVTSGYSKPLVSVDVGDVPQLVRCVLLHTTILSLKGELDQFVSGLDDVKVLQLVQKCPTLFHSFFVAYKGTTLTAGEYFTILNMYPT